VLQGPRPTILQPRTHCARNAGHFANSCPNSRSRPRLPPEATSAPPPTRNGSSTPAQAQQNYARGRVNQVALEEAHNATTMVPGTSLINSISS
jgi:hypothetical protein